MDKQKIEVALATPKDGVMVARPANALGMLDIKRLAVARKEFAEFVSGQLKEGIHFGVVPGTSKPTLLKPGAEEVVRLYQCAATFPASEMIVREDFTVSPPLYAYRVLCRIVDAYGVVRAEGWGSCSSMESKYRYRYETWRGPGKADPAQGWAPNKWGKMARRIDNPDVSDQQNTILKMACKRAQVAAALSLGCASEYFTQDVDDLADAHVDEPTENGQAAKIVNAFAAIDIPEEDIAAYLGHTLAATSLEEIEELRAIYGTIKAGATTWVEVARVSGKPKAARDIAAKARQQRDTRCPGEDDT